MFNFAGFNFVGLSATTRRVFFGVWILFAMALLTGWLATGSPMDLWFVVLLALAVLVTIVMLVWTIRGPSEKEGGEPGP